MSESLLHVLTNLGAIVHVAEEGGFWAEVTALPGCASLGETLQDLLFNLREAIEGCTAVQEFVAPAQAWAQ